MFNPLVIPDTWDNLFVGNKPALRTAAGWTCAWSVLFALVAAGGLGSYLIQHGDTISTTHVALPAIVISMAFLLFLCGKFIAFVADIRETVRTIPADQSAIVLRAARSVIRLFYTLVTIIGIALIVTRMLLVQYQ